jgi:hypothetical protein
MNYPNPPRKEGGALDSFFRHPMWSAIIAGLVVAAIVGIVHIIGGGGAAKSQAAPKSNPASEGLGSKTDSPSSALDSPTSSPGQPESAAPSSGAIRIVNPVNQSGWTIVWHGVLDIGLPGVAFSRVGAPQQGTGSQFDLQYQGAGGWNPRGNFYYWDIPAAPGPASCEAVNYAAGSISVSGAANLGEKYCFLPSSGGMDLYMQVTAVSASSVTVDTWEWSENSF